MSLLHERELTSEVVDSGFTFPTSIRPHHALSRVAAFLDKSPLFDSDKLEWRDIPKSPQQGLDLFDAIFIIFRAICSEFGCAKLTPTSRPRGLVRTHSAETVNIERSDKSIYSLRAKPAVIITGVGPNFPPELLQIHDPSLFCVIPLELKVEDDWDDVKLQVQACIYARQCFMQQKNRKFVFVLVMSEISVGLYQFDRTGLQQFAKFNYHKHPLDFLRLLIGLTGTDDEACGFDTSIFWKGICRYMRNVDEKNVPFEYKLDRVIPSQEFTGLGTFWWLANDVHGTSLIIEETWRFADQQPGDKLLDLIRGVDGVGQVLACEESFNTSRFRGPRSADSLVRPRVRSRIVFKGYENTIDKFKSRKEFLNGFRDAVAGHRNLWKKGVLHRNISINNIRLGQDCAGPGNTGVLIGLYHGALILEGSKKLELADHRIGEPRFQSIMVASSCPTFEDYSPFNYDYESAPHDYLDDLESFFYIFVWICLGYEGPGCPHAPALEQFSIWDEEGIFSAHAKRWLLSERTDGKWEVSTYFGPIFQTLFRELRIFVGERLNTKVKALRLYDWPRKPSDFKYVDEDYTIFLGFIDKALKALDEETLLGELQAPVIPRIPILLPRVAPPALHGPLANIMLVMPRNKQPHPSPKQPADENDGAGMLPNAEQSLKDSPTERRLLHRHPLYQPLGPLR